MLYEAKSHFSIVFIYFSFGPYYWTYIIVCEGEFWFNKREKTKICVLIFDNSSTYMYNPITAAS